MKKRHALYLAAIAMLGLIAVTSCTNGPKPEDTRFPTDSQYNAVAEGVTAGVKEAEDWCEQPQPTAEAGKVSVYYKRNEAGECIATFRAYP